MTSAVANSPFEAPKSGRWLLFGWLAFAYLIAAQAISIAISPPDRDMGDLQKILYIHVPAAWNMGICYFLVAIYSMRYLWKRDERDDLKAAAAAEVGTLLNGLTLVLGMIWGRPTWGVWWAWDARLTSTLVMFLIFAGYLALRAFVDEPERRAQWSAAAGLFGAINYPIVYMSVRWWRTLHQVQSTPDTLDPSYALSLRLNAFAILFIAIFFIRRRYEAALTERVAEHELQAAVLGGSSRG
ncbi:MAG: cytochrome c biogenesis protein CcsA [Gemmatimonadetes bacterium]|nr:cytochrome c biogenesis protein CcsA [Gemmatimonadota bacterium]